jgi:hypothetical protein
MAFRPLPILLAVGATPVDINRAPSNLKIVAHNAGGSPAFVQLFDAKAADVVLGTTVAQYVFQVSPGDNETPIGELYFRNAISVACTTTPTGAVAALCDISPAVA